jgi:hypothetical protein
VRFSCLEELGYLIAVTCYELSAYLSVLPAFLGWLRQLYVRRLVEERAFQEWKKELLCVFE